MSEIIMIALYILWATAAYLAIGFLGMNISRVFYGWCREIKAKPKTSQEILLILIGPFTIIGKILLVIFCVLTVISSVCAFVFGLSSYFLTKSYLDFLDSFYGGKAKKKPVESAKAESGLNSVDKKKPVYFSLDSVEAFFAPPRPKPPKSPWFRGIW